MITRHVFDAWAGPDRVPESNDESGRGALYWSLQEEVMAQIVIVALVLLTAHVAVCQDQVRVVWSVDGVAQHQR